MDSINEQLTNIQLDDELLQRIAQLDNLNLYEIMNLKALVEKELDQNLQHLDNHNADMTSSLVTPDGYPRNDIDVLQVRYIRRNINMLQNDLARILEKSYSLLPTHFQNNNNNISTNEVSIENSVSNFNLDDYIIPFAIIEEITKESPAEKAGLEIGDKIIYIGKINASNHNRLKALGPEVKSSEDKNLKVKIQRNTELLNITLIPTQKWPGVGLLGCKFVEI